MTRIAPTPSGFLHEGNAYNFLLAEQIARERGIGLRLRIDDGDAPRCRPEYLTDIFDSLRWLGIFPDAGPADPEDHNAHFSQRLRAPLYEEYLRLLAEAGQLFACTCSRAQIAAVSPDGQYPGTCRDRNLPLHTPDAAWRLRTPEGAQVGFRDNLLGECAVSIHDAARYPVVRRRDGIAAYSISSLADDVLYGTTAIVRGEDLLSATGVQIYLASLLPLARNFRNVVFYHHPLLRREGEKLSKSAGAFSLKAMSEAGVTASAVRKRFSEWAAKLPGRG